MSGAGSAIASGTEEAPVGGSGAQGALLPGDGAPIFFLIPGDKYGYGYDPAFFFFRPAPEFSIFLANVKVD